MLTMKAKYALRAMCALARAEGGRAAPAPRHGRLQARAIAEHSGAPSKFLESILVDLREAGFILSRRGQKGGHTLARPADQIMVGDVIRAIDGPLAPVRCASVSAYQPCADCADPDACSLRALMREARDALSNVLDRRSVRELALMPDFGAAAIDPVLLDATFLSGELGDLS
ncbi:Rrf2 family transcriptional regulator [Lysobacter sp. K5869]|uniref:RrF2 family transcriptional regulator n=1 Tax=Lysobacter sp. K5869 TaxID=2820808 RepID=UPI001C060230|nr:Rrf2 family transcriptional regulator [Lysobacter sp. K5869]QWP77305.1 Rrf2 family transcriptional regulator [Lysobacter sp. K5869]